MCQTGAPDPGERMEAGPGQTGFCCRAHARRLKEKHVCGKADAPLEQNSRFVPACSSGTQRETWLCIYFHIRKHGLQHQRHKVLPDKPNGGRVAFDWAFTSCD